MKYWERWIGDWKKKTADLSACQKGIYGELLDHCYATDSPLLPLSEDACCRIAGAHGREECAAVKLVLERYFDRSEQGYFHSRVAEEVDKRTQFIAQQRALAVRRWHPPQPKGNGEDKPEEFAPPDWIPRDAWNKWIAGRPRRTRTKHALELAIERLDKFRSEGVSPRSVLENSALSGYRGLFKPPLDKTAVPDYDFEAIAKNEQG